MRLRAGRIGGSPAWDAVLGQEGLAWDRVEAPDALSVESFSVVVVDRPLDRAWESALGRYVDRGGAALLAPETLAAWRPGARWSRFRRLRPTAGSGLRECGTIDFRGRGLSVPGAGEMVTGGGQRVLPIVRRGDGLVATLPIDPGACFNDRRVRRRFFASPVPPDPSERVSRVPRGEVRQMLRGTLRALHHRRGIPYAHLWYFPGESASLVGLRIDTDFASRKDVEALYRLMRELGLPATWFLHVKAHIGWLRVFAEMVGQEIGVHGYGHDPPGRDASRLRDGLERARDLLRGAGLAPRGFAAPYGVWRAALPATLASLGFRYSSEFALDYDNLPWYPDTGVEGGEVAQVPVHPVSIGNLRVGRHGVEAMTDYYAAVSARKLRRDEPLFFYAHPGEGRIPVLRALLERLSGEGHPSLSLGEYASWWAERRARLCGTVIRLEGGEISVEGAPDGTGRFRVAVEHPERGRTFLPCPFGAGSDPPAWSSRRTIGGAPAEPRPPIGRPFRRVYEDLRACSWRRRR